MVAVIQGTKEEKVFLVKEWINTNERDYPFVKYINNCFPIPYLSITAPFTTWARVEFLVFA
jgi:hypothetical protein